MKESELIFGVHPVLEKLASNPEEVMEILVVTTLRGRTFEQIEERARRHGCPVGRTDLATLDALTNHSRHQGVAAKVAPFKYEPFHALLESLKLPDPRCVVFLDGLTDPRNFGSILRTSEAMGIGDVVIPKDRAAGVTATVIKASAGAAHHVRIYRVSNLARSLVAVRDQGLWILGLDPRADHVLYKIDLPARLGVVLGAEGAGIRPLVRSKCDFWVSLPMRGKVGSMNVSVAWGMCAYELMRQRATGSG
jgi:23S rRNA (guanosine2251-2'-O)-methyltransferase